jgi:hypothetical protein
MRHKDDLARARDSHRGRGSRTYAFPEHQEMLGTWQAVAGGISQEASEAILADAPQHLLPVEGLPAEVQLTQPVIEHEGALQRFDDRLGRLAAAEKIAREDARARGDAAGQFAGGAAGLRASGR